jgi:hypothetical protein
MLTAVPKNTKVITGVTAKAARYIATVETADDSVSPPHRHVKDITDTADGTAANSIQPALRSPLKKYATTKVTAVKKTKDRTKAFLTSLI